MSTCKMIYIPGQGIIRQKNCINLHWNIYVRIFKKMVTLNLIDSRL